MLVFPQVRLLVSVGHALACQSVHQCWVEREMGPVQQGRIPPPLTHIWMIPAILLINSGLSFYHIYSLKS